MRMPSLYVNRPLHKSAATWEDSICSVMELVVMLLAKLPVGWPPRPLREPTTTVMLLLSQPKRYYAWMAVKSAIWTVFPVRWIFHYNQFVMPLLLLTNVSLSCQRWLPNIAAWQPPVWLLL